MDKSRLTAGLMTALLGGTMLAGTAEAVHLSNNGIGQALVYSYYTVSAQQQTVLSVVNTSSAAKAVKVRFHEGYNGRPVLDFNLFLSPYDVWTGTVFALADAGIAGDGAAILTQDRSCTAPSFSEAGTTLPSSGQSYVAFRDFYLIIDDGGPYTLDRTREGHFEIIAMADLSAPLSAAVTHNASGVPANCAVVRNLVGNETGINPPSSGIFGTAGIIDVQRGTYFAYDADALEDFTSRALFTETESLLPNLNDVNDRAVGGSGMRATALVVTPKGATLSAYPGPDPRSRHIDAVSAVFMADSLYNEYLTTSSLAANTDWVVTFPTKQFYVDDLYTAGFAIPPFTRWYNNGSCTTSGTKLLNREERTTVSSTLPGSPPPPQPIFCRQTNILSFMNTPTGVTATSSEALKSRLFTNVRPVVGDAGWLQVNLDPIVEPHALLPAINGNIHRGLPVTGFAAISVTNNNATVINGVSTLSNYSSTSKHRSTSRCINGTEACD